MKKKTIHNILFSFFLITSLTINYFGDETWLLWDGSAPIAISSAAGLLIGPLFKLIFKK